MTAILKVGLTGGIGSGKTTVSNMFAELGVPVIDADEISRAVTRRGSSAFDAVVALLGSEMVGSDGELRRDRIRAAVFDDDALRRRLESVIHPLVHEEIRRRVRDLRRPYCILSIPLLLEAGSTVPVDRILVVDCPEELQLARVVQRDAADRSGVLAIIRAQAARNERLQKADDVISNDRDLDHLHAQVRLLHDKYRSLANLNVATSA